MSLVSLMPRRSERPTCLLVDDDEFSRLRITRAIDRASLPLDVTVAQSLASARAKLSNTYFDYLILDHHLPDGFGTEFLREMQYNFTPRWGQALILTGLPEHAEASLSRWLDNTEIVDKANFGSDTLASWFQNGQNAQSA